ncbi:hypothetical protein B0A63_21600, partial [Flavobacterium johnsoniae UW101]|uniref:T9SS type B sorting domain-containing protein n=1 Tax=Flavobacterium johnsoniae TaxID=986 RepID=UPI000B91F28F
NGTSYQSSGTFANLLPGSYTVLVKDAFGCTSTAIAQTIANEFTVATVLTDGPKCTSPNITIDGTINGGTANYNYTVTINGTLDPTVHTVAGTTFTYTDATAVTATTTTTYLFTFTDNSGCNATSTVVVQPKTNPDFTAVQGNLIYCSGQETGSINVNIDTTVGVGPYVINVVKDNTALGTPNVNYGTQTTGLPGGDYIVTVTDANGCSLNRNVSIAQPDPIVFTEDIQQIKCIGGGAGTALGSIGVTALAGGTTSGLALPAKSGFIYTLTSNTSPTQTFTPDGRENHSFQILNFGIYELTVTDFNGCSVTKTINIASPPEDMIIDVTQGTPSCTSATIVVSVTPPIPGGPYHFALYPVDPANPNNYDYATYSASYQDADAVSPPASPGDPDLLKSTFTGLNPGVLYSFIVYDESTNCYFFKQADTKTPTLSTLTSDLTESNVTCMNAGDGSVSFTFTKNYTTTTTVNYQVYNSQTNQPVVPAITGSVTGLNGNVTSPVQTAGPLVPGTYYILFTEVGGSTPGCTNSSRTFTITQSVVPVLVNATVNKNQNCNELGNISVSAQGGTAPYKYLVLSDTAPAPTAGDAWVDGSSFNLAAGNYIAYAKDANGCIQPAAVKVIPLDPTPVVAAVLAAQCNVAEGSFVINVTVPTAGVSPYTFSVDGGAFQSRTAPFSITGLSSGSHTIEIKDKNGCGNTVTVPILKPLGFTPEVTALPTCPNNDGQITVTAAGGSSTYSYELLDASASTVLAGPQASNVFNAVAAGSYQVRVTDVTTTCALVKPILLTSPAPVNFTASPTDVSCNGGSNGTIKVTLGAGNTDPVYTYTLTALSGPALVVGPQTSNLFTGLSARDYSISVASGRLGCSTPQTITVGQPPVLSVDASSAAAPFKCAPDNSTNTTIVTINGSGGFGDYTYSINNVDFYPTNTFTVADNGTTYNLPVYVKDANGCSAIGSVLITRLTRITTVTVAGTAIDCLNNGRADITVLGGSGNFSYQLLPSGAPQVDNFFGITAPGDYYFRVIDNDTDCYFDAPVFRVAPYNTIKAVATATTPVNCFGDANGALAINVTGYTGAYTYEVFNSAGTSVMGPIGSDTTVNPRSISGLSAGNYTVVVTETASPYCSVTTNAVTIGSPSEAVSVTASTVNDNCGTNAGQIIAEGHGGTAPYYYQILPQGSPAPLVTDAGWSTVTTLNAESGNYTVYVKDSRDCPSSVNVILGLDPSPVVAAVLAAQCNVAEGNFVINVTVPTAGVSPYTFSVDGGAFQSRTAPFSITGLSSGSHTIEIKDKNGCGNTVTVPILAPLELRSEITLTPVCNNPSGDITLFASGGTVSTPSSYVYTMNNWATSQSSPVFGGLAPGSYTFRVRDIVTNCEKEVTQIIENATVVTGITLKPTAVSCNGGSDGTISVELDASNNNPIYRYTLTATIAGVPLTVGPQDSTLFSGLSAGTYTVSVTSGRGCPGTATITVDEPAPIVVDAPLVTQYVCAAGTNTSSRATITVNSVNGGSNNYVIYEFTRGTTVVQRGLSNSYTETDYAGGSYSVKVLDSKGCSGVTTAPITIDPFISLDNMAIAVTPITCVADESIQVTVTTTGGTPPTLYYTVTGNGYNQTNTTGTFTDLGIGSYFITVENRVTNCMLRQFHNVINPNTFNIVAAAVNAEICYGATNGSVDLTFIDNLPNPTDKAGPFDYTISGPMPDITESTTNAGPVRISNLIAGDYKVVAKLRGTPECTVETVFSILQPLEPLALSLEQTRITCVSGNDDGTITATATGGWEGDYQFELVGPYGTINYSDQYKFENLREGTYTITVKDSKGCMDIQTITLTKPDPITFTAAADVTVLSCFGGQDATITVSAPTGGQGSNYTYTLNYTVDGEAVFVGPQSSNVFTNLGAGDYTVTVKDGFTCEATSAVISIANPTIIEPTLSLDKAITCLTNARLTLSVTGGTGPYTYSEDGTNYSVTSFNSSVTFEVTPGLHRYFVKDNVGCISYVSNDFEVIPVTPLTVELNTDNAKVNCKDESTALIVAEAVGGLGNYEYSLLDGAGTEIRPAQPDGVFADLPAGTYTVHVKSVDCEANSTTIVVSQPENALTGDYTVVPVKCFGDNNGKIVVTASGGTGTIKYAIEPNLDQFFESGTFERLTAGTYTVIVQDLAGCNIIYEIDVVQPNILTAYEVPGSMIPEICKGDKDGAFTIEIQGGTAPYFESLDKDNGPFNPVLATTVDYTGLSGGRHTVFIKDSNGCIYPVEVNMPESVVLDPKYTVSYDCVNNAQSNMVVITIDPSNNPADIDYSLDGGTIQPGNIFTNIPAGDHTIRVRHTNGCTADVDFNIIGYAPLQLTLTEEKGVWNVITASAVGGGGEYVYSIDGVNFSSETKFKIYKTGTYTITVRDKNGCTDTKDYYIEYVDVCLDNYFTPNGDGVNDTWGPGCTNIYNHLKFSIFDRYGRVIAKYTYGQKWDGRYNGEELPSGDYWYVLKLNDENDGREFVGHFTLYR